MKAPKTLPIDMAINHILAFDSFENDLINNGFASKQDKLHSASADSDCFPFIKSVLF